MEIIETGALRRVDAERTEDVAVVQLFQGIYGVGMFVLDIAPHHFSSRTSVLQGQSIAYAWYFSGCRTLDDIRERKGGIKLSSVQEIGLKYYDGTTLCHVGLDNGSDICTITDINTRMPREEARDIFEEIRSIGESSRFDRVLGPKSLLVLALSLDPKLFVEIMGSYRRSVLCSLLRARTHAYVFVQGKVDVWRHRYHDYAFSSRWQNARWYAL